MKSQLSNEQKAQQMDSYLKKSLRGAVLNHHKQNKKMRERETTFDSLTNSEQKMLSHFDKYDFDDHSFNVLGITIVVTHDELGEALSRLPKDLREVILLSYFEEMNDREIGEFLNLGNSTVAYRRKNTMSKLKKLMEEEINE